MSYSFEKGEELYYSGNYEESFAIFKAILNDAETTSVERSDALNMLGVLLDSDPNLILDSEFQQSVKFFKRAIELNPDNLGALLNVIEGFGNSFNQHRDLELFKLAYDKLLKLSNKLSISDRKLMQNKYDLYKDIGNEIFPSE